MTKLSHQLPQGAEPPPFNMDDSGAIRVGGTRVTLDVIVSQYENGMSPEEMVRAYDTLRLEDIYAAIAYYLRHRDEVHAYLRHRDSAAETLRGDIEKQARVSRSDLLARRERMGKNDAPTGK